MAFQLIRPILEINNYSGDMKPTVIGDYECDTQSDLPVQSQSSYYIGIGSRAHVIEDNSEWCMRSNGNWVMQESGTAAYTKAEVDALLDDKANKATTLSGYGITNAYTKTQTDNLLSAKADANNVYTKTQTDNLLADKITTSQAVSGLLGVDDAIVVPNAGYDLNTLAMPGIYLAKNTNSASASTNRPDYSSAAAKIWRLEVKLLNEARAFQELFVYRIGTYEGDFERYMRIAHTGGTWNDWLLIGTTAVPTYTPS